MQFWVKSYEQTSSSLQLVLIDMKVNKDILKNKITAQNKQKRLIFNVVPHAGQENQIQVNLCTQLTILRNYNVIITQVFT